VNLQDVRVPTEVASAQQDAIKAREDRDRYSLAAQAYANDLIPRARGEGVRRIEDAHAYSAKVIADAEGEAQRFTKLLTEYEQAPGVTRERLYLETVESVLASSKKVIVGTEGNGNLLYLPLDKLLEQPRATGRPSETETTMTVEGSGPGGNGGLESDRRTRGSR
jgi:membrane protease subunit HflK